MDVVEIPTSSHTFWTKPTVWGHMGQMGTNKTTSTLSAINM